MKGLVSLLVSGELSTWGAQEDFRNEILLAAIGDKTDKRVTLKCSQEMSWAKRTKRVAMLTAFCRVLGSLVVLGLVSSDSCRPP